MQKGVAPETAQLRLKVWGRKKKAGGVNLLVLAADADNPA